MWGGEKRGQRVLTTYRGSNAIHQRTTLLGGGEKGIVLLKGAWNPARKRRKRSPISYLITRSKKEKKVFGDGKSMSREGGRKRRAKVMVRIGKRLGASKKKEEYSDLQKRRLGGKGSEGIGSPDTRKKKKAPRCPGSRE